VVKVLKCELCSGGLWNEREDETGHKGPGIVSGLPKVDLFRQQGRRDRTCRAYEEEKGLIWKEEGEEGASFRNWNLLHEGAEIGIVFSG